MNLALDGKCDRASFAATAASAARAIDPVIIVMVMAMVMVMVMMVMVMMVKHRTRIVERRYGSFKYGFNI